MTVAQDLYLKPVANAQVVALGQQIRQPVAGKFDRHTPAHHALLEQQTQGDGVVAVKRVPGDERQLTFRAQINDAEIAGFNQKFAVIDIALQFAQLRGRLHQREGGKHHLFTASRQRFCHVDPVADFGGATFAAYRFAEVNRVRAAACRLLVKIFQRLFWPVIKHWP